MKTTITRRQFIQRSTLAASTLAIPTFVPNRVFGANERLNVAGIGAGGKGAVDIDGCSRENIVAMADVDYVRAQTSFKRFDKAIRYNDFRQMLEKEGKNIDAVTVSTPDHTHAVAAAMAIKMGKHVYCQKPLTHTVSEARILTKLARQHKVATQMGNQGHSNPDSRRLVELIQAGVLGEVKEAHVWTNRPVWPQGIDRPKEKPPTPDTLDWDLWLGTAPVRPYHPAYLPFKWRGWWDFGTGALGDMGCHNQDLAYWALELRDPTSVEAKSSGVNNETAPKWSEVTYQFPKTKNRGPVKLKRHCRLMAVSLLAPRIPCMCRCTGGRASFYREQKPRISTRWRSFCPSPRILAAIIIRNGLMPAKGASRPIQTSIMPGP